MEEIECLTLDSYIICVCVVSFFPVHLFSLFICVVV